MSHTRLPTATDLSALLYSSGMITAPPSSEQAQADYDTAITAASDEWSRVTSYTPFLADSAAVLRKFDPPGPKIRGTRYSFRAQGGGREVPFDNGLVSLTSMTTGVDSVSTGTVRTLGTDFYLYPENAAAEGAPWTSAIFVLPIWGSQQSVQVLGKWGYAAAIPDDAWQAILFMAALPLIGSLENLMTGAVVELREEDEYQIFRTRSGLGPFNSIAVDWQKRVDRAKKRYVRL